MLFNPDYPSPRADHIPNQNHLHCVSAQLKWINDQSTPIQTSSAPLAPMLRIDGKSVQKPLPESSENGLCALVSITQREACSRAEKALETVTPPTGPQAFLAASFASTSR